MSGRESSFLKHARDALLRIGSNPSRYPTLGHKELDLELLFNEVMSRGGLDEVIRTKQWGNIARLLHLPPSCTNAGYALRNLYQKWLYPLEVVKTHGKDAPTDVLTRFVSSKRSRKRAHDELGSQRSVRPERRSKRRKVWKEDEFGEDDDEFGEDEDENSVGNAEEDEENERSLGNVESLRAKHTQTPKGGESDDPSDDEYTQVCRTPFVVHLLDTTHTTHPPYSTDLNQCFNSVLESLLACNAATG
jgi:hypothetical protein